MLKSECFSKFDMPENSSSYLSHDFENTVRSCIIKTKRLYTHVLYISFHIRIVLKNTYICGWIQWACFCMAITDAHSSCWDVFHRIIILKRKLKRKICVVIIMLQTENKKISFWYLIKNLKKMCANLCFIFTKVKK